MNGDDGIDKAIQARLNEVYADHRRKGDDVMNARLRLEKDQLATTAQSAAAAIARGDDPEEG